ncbi:MAG: hypothetical protein L5657_00490 [Calditerricola sp.]|nr:hypothetical protein [Bacillota bacterium]MCG0313126.1 hypothetical protein [Calditerricola sp.]
MPNWIVWGLALYGLAALWVWAIVPLGHPVSRRGPVCVVLLVENSGHIVEGLLRSLFWWAYCHGRDLWVTVVDFGSSDDTLGIVRGYARYVPHGIDIRVGRAASWDADVIRRQFGRTEHAHVVVIDARIPPPIRDG